MDTKDSEYSGETADFHQSESFSGAAAALGQITPSPWKIDFENNLIHALDDRHTIICNLGNTKNPDVAADARLIVAAPELLEALDLIEAKASGGLCQFGLEGKHLFLKDIREIVEQAKALAA